MEQLNYRLEHFEGPLDLLLHLIEKNKIDIYDIPIAEITVQYMEYVSHMEEEDLDIVSDFLVMAATLLDIKSAMLLPKEETEEGEETDPRAELVARLLEYKKFRLMGHRLQDGEDLAERVLYKEPTIPEEVAKYVPPLDKDALLRGLTLEKLEKLYREILRRREASIDRVRSGFGVIKREKISLEGRIRDVLSYARRHGHFSFRHMTRKSRNRMEVVVSFLAVLELMKMGKITLVQEKPFADMDIQAVDDGREDTELDLSGLEDF